MCLACSGQELHAAKVAEVARLRDVGQLSQAACGPKPLAAGGPTARTSEQVAYSHLRRSETCATKARILANSATWHART